jgi:hypothetical protein
MGGAVTPSHGRRWGKLKADRRPLSTADIVRAFRGEGRVAMRARSLLVRGFVVAGLLLGWSNPAGAADQKTFCATNLNIQLQLGQLADASPNGQPTAAQLEQVRGQILALVDQEVSTAPAGIVSQVKVIAKALHANFKAVGDVYAVGPGVNNAAASDASQRIDAYTVKHCGYPVINVTAVDNKFRGVPTTLKTGILLVNLRNKGSDTHEVTIARITTSDSVQTLLSLPQGQAKTRLDILGNTQADPGSGQPSVGYFNLTQPGRYIAFDAIPKGTKGQHTGKGPLHVKLGMYAEITVT